MNFRLHSTEIFPYKFLCENQQKIYENFGHFNAHSDAIKSKLMKNTHDPFEVIWKVIKGNSIN